MILLGACSQCNMNFQDGMARHILGSFPLEQFCTYMCAEKYLENSRGLKHAILLPASSYSKIAPRKSE